MSSSLPHLFAAAEETTRELPMPPLAFGVIAMLAFLALLGILWGFRGTAQTIATRGHHGQTGHHGQSGDHGAHGHDGVHGDHPGSHH